MCLLDDVTVPGALEVLLSERATIQDWCRQVLDWPEDVEVWPYVGQQVGRRAEAYPRVYAAWRARAKPGRPRKPLARLDDTPLVVLVTRRSEYASRSGLYCSGLPGIPPSTECFDLKQLRNLNPDGRVKEAWVYDDESGDLIGGWCRGFASKTVANRWYQNCRLLVDTQFPFKRGKARTNLSTGWMAGSGLALSRATGELHEYLTKPNVRREPDGLTARANCAATSRLVREFLTYVEAYEPTLSEELVEFHKKFPEEPPPMWITYNYQVSGRPWLYAS